MRTTIENQKVTVGVDQTDYPLIEWLEGGMKDGDAIEFIVDTTGEPLDWRMIGLKGKDKSGQSFDPAQDRVWSALFTLGCDALNYARSGMQRKN